MTDAAAGRGSRPVSDSLTQRQRAGPFIEQMMDRRRVRGGRNPLAEARIGKHLGDRCQDPEVLVGCVLRHENHEEYRHALPIGCAELYRKPASHQQDDRLGNADDAGVRDRDAMAKTRRSALFAPPQRPKNGRVVQVMPGLDPQGGLLQDM